MLIKVLPTEVAARIAAGEVVERPASVVKELVENSLDAGASQITIEVRGGGVNLLRVIDNGAGIPAEEVELAFRRYATSKLSRFEDLESIATLGFRGEALPSIAAVAQVDMVTCTADVPVGTHITLSGGAVTYRGSEGRPPGTTVAVRELLRNVPARLKFLKSQATENGHVANVVSHYALAFPEVKFVLLMEGRVSLRTPGSGRLIDAVAQLYGGDMAGRLIEIRDEGWETGPAKVSGLVSPPEISRPGRDYLSLFVNRRWISSRLLAWAVEEAYHGLLMVGRHPVAIINVALLPNEVDVNIHPAKTEVKFRNEPAVFAAVQRAVRRTLLDQAPVPRVEEVAVRFAPPPAGLSPLPVAGASISPPSPAAPTPAITLPVLRVLGQFLASYIVAEGPDGLYLIDQHAAHERVLYEQVMDSKSAGEARVQGLLEPVPLAVSPQQEQVFEEVRGQLAGFGFNIEPFGERTYIVRAVPAVLSGRGWMNSLMELLEASPTVGGWVEEIAKSIACHGAVRAGQVLARDEIEGLVRQLEKASVPHTCPHGRPTIVRISPEQIRAEFGRR